MPFANARIYQLGENKYEAIYYEKGWVTESAKDKLKNKYNYLKSNSRGQSPDYEENRKKTITKARGNIRRKINKYNLDRFWTLTFAENITDVGEADKLFRNFVKRINRRFPEFKYICVREFQERGAVHYHSAVNSYIAVAELTKIWGEGHVWVKREKNGSSKLINYLCKYFTKHSDDERLKGFNIYLCSQGLVIPHYDININSRHEFLTYLETKYGGVLFKQILDYEDKGITAVI